MSDLTKVYHPSIPDIFYEVDNAVEWQESGWLLNPPKNAAAIAARDAALASRDFVAVALPPVAPPASDGE